MTRKGLKGKKMLAEIEQAFNKLAIPTVITFAVIAHALYIQIGV